MGKQTHLQKGFTLIEMAVALVVFGLVIGTAFNFLNPLQDEEARQITMSRQKKIAASIASYAQLRGAIPCPSEVHNWIGEARASCASDAAREGIVPYINLGLSPDDIMDGWGNLFTYTVSENAANPDFSNVHQNCRVDSIWNIGGNNINTLKAGFCCGRAGTFQSMSIYSDKAKTTLIADTQPSTAPSGTFATVNAASSATVSTNLAYFAYALISHGKNGAGAYVLGVAGHNADSVDIMGVAEKENAEIGGDNGDVIVLPENYASGNDYFDDIILWRTQQGVISELNNDSCAKP